MTTTLKDGLKRITEAIARGNGRFALGAMDADHRKMSGSSSPFALAAGSAGVIRIHARHPSGGRREGFVVMIGMTRMHLLELREMIDELLTQESHAAS